MLQDGDWTPEPECSAAGWPPGELEHWRKLLAHKPREVVELLSAALALDDAVLAAALVTATDHALVGATAAIISHEAYRRTTYGWSDGWYELRERFAAEMAARGLDVEDETGG